MSVLKERPMNSGTPISFSNKKIIPYGWIESLASK